MSATSRLTILGTGNIGRAMASGMVASGKFKPGEIALTRRHSNLLDDLAEQGYETGSDNVAAVRRADVILIAVEPQQLDGLLGEIAGALDPLRHLVISVVSGAGIEAIVRKLGKDLPVVRAMPNTAAALGCSMTCLAANAAGSERLSQVEEIFKTIGETLTIDEEQMTSATALCACGIAFFLRAVRAASQAGIEIGFHPEQALAMAAQTALGAASLVLSHGSHPEREIDSVTTPRGCTIAGLNEMEHQGFSSAMIRGIVTSAEKAGALY